MNFILFALFIVLLFLVIFLYARLKDEIKNIKGRGIVEEVKKEIEGLIVEFNKVSNRKIIVMDEKIKELENLVRLADDRILKLDSLTRNYAEIVKRYEIAKREFQSAVLQSSNSRKSEQPKKIDRKKVEFNSINLPNQVVSTRGDKVNKGEGVLFENGKVKAVVDEKAAVEDFELEEIFGKKEIIEDELKKIKIEELEINARANLLHKLLSLGFDEDALVELGFSPSEIEIAKIVLNKK